MTESERDGEGGERSLLVLAATSLRPVMPDLLAGFAETSHPGARVVYGSSSALAAQVESGAPADLLLAADERSVDRLVGRGLVARGDPRPYAAGRLVLIWRDGADPPADLMDLRREEYRAIAIANPRTAPYGAAAVQALRSAELLPGVEKRLVYGESVADAYQFVRTGNADVGIVAESLGSELGSPYRVPVDPGLHSPVIHMAAVLAGADQARAAALLDFILSEAGQSILASHGLDPADR